MQHATRNKQMTARKGSSGVAGAWRWLRDHQHFTIMIALLIVVAGVWVFIGIGDEVIEGGTQRFDQWVINHLQQPAPAVPVTEIGTVPIGPAWLREVGRDITALG